MRTTDGSTNFASLSSADLHNVQALNLNFLRLVQAQPEALNLPGVHEKALSRLGQRQVRRMAEAPFLLFSLQQRNLPRWRALLVEQPEQDLFSAAQPESFAASELTITAVAYLWQLAQSNPYTVRIVSGAGPSWCDLISSLPLAELTSRLRGQVSLIQPRATDDQHLWDMLLRAAVSDQAIVRFAARTAACQSLLTRASERTNNSWSLAACATHTPQLHVADAIKKPQ